MMKTHFAWMLLPLATVSAVVAATAPAVQADAIRRCENYGVVRDRNDHEAPLLPRRSVAHCARSYQTLYQTYRVLPVSPESRRSDTSPVSDTARSSTRSQMDRPVAGATDR